MFPRNVSCFRFSYSFRLHCVFTKTQREKDMVQGSWSKDFLFLEQCRDFQRGNYRRCCIHLSKKIIHHAIISSFLCIRDVFFRKLSEGSTNIKIVSRRLQTSLTNLSIFPLPGLPILIFPNTRTRKQYSVYVFDFIFIVFGCSLDYTARALNVQQDMVDVVFLQYITMIHTLLITVRAIHLNVRRGKYKGTPEDYIQLTIEDATPKLFVLTLL